MENLVGPQCLLLPSLPDPFPYCCSGVRNGRGSGSEGGSRHWGAGSRGGNGGQVVRGAIGDSHWEADGALGVEKELGAGGGSRGGQATCPLLPVPPTYFPSLLSASLVPVLLPFLPISPPHSPPPPPHLIAYHCSGASSLQPCSSLGRKAWPQASPVAVVLAPCFSCKNAQVSYCWIFL